MIEMGAEKESGKSLLSARYDDDDNDDSSGYG